jgi:glycosyltransferase involved in cell wall biosynthesis
MKISFIVPEMVISGGMRLIFEYASRLSDRGHIVCLYSPVIPFNPHKYQFRLRYFKYQASYFLKYLSGRIKLPDITNKINFDVKYVPSVRSIFIPDADAVIATAWTTSYYVNKLSEEKGRKFYLIQDHEIWNSNVKYSEKSYLLPLKRIVISGYLKNLLKQKYNADSTLILNGMNFEKYYNNDKKFYTPRRILFMDHSLDNKNVEGAIETAVKLKKKYTDIIIRAFGVNKYHQMPEFIEFHSKLSDEEVRKLYCTSDIFIFPSKFEGFGGPPAEAMGCKCAVVGNAVAALPEYAKHMETAILCNPENHNELFEGVCYLIENEDELKRISLSGYEYARKKLDFNRATSELENLLMN